MRWWIRAAAAAAVISGRVALAADDSAATRPAVPLEPSAVTAPDFDAGEHLFGDPFGLRSKLAGRGVSIDPSVILDEAKVLRGGLDTAGDAPRGRFSLALTVDADKLAGLHGGTGFALFQDQFGVNASQRLVGDAQNFAFGTDIGTRAQLTQLWYQQTLLPGDWLRVKAGKVDANADFDVLDNAQEFLNAGWGPTRRSRSCRATRTRPLASSYSSSRRRGSTSAVGCSTGRWRRACTPGRTGRASSSTGATICFSWPRRAAGTSCRWGGSCRPWTA